MRVLVTVRLGGLCRLGRVGLRVLVGVKRWRRVSLGRLWLVLSIQVTIVICS